MVLVTLCRIYPAELSRQVQSGGGRQRFPCDGGGSGSPEDPPTKEKSRGFIVLTLVGFEDFLAQANGLRRDLDHLVVTDEFESLFQIE